MSFGLWDTPSGRDRRWLKRRAYTPAPTYARVVVVLLAAALLGTLAWQGVQRLLHPANIVNGGPARLAPARPSDAGGIPAWQAGVSGALEDATMQGVGGNITAAEVDVDRAQAILMSTRMQSIAATPDFFLHSDRALDEVLATHPDNARLLEHVTLARIELAQLRSAQAATPGVAEGNAGGALTGVAVGPGTQAPHAVSVAGHEVLAAPRAVLANELLDPAALHGNTYVDATLMPDTSEILLPPSTRVMADGVRVAGLTFAGASQTLDGIRWKNVTFIGTRLRYEGGEISLENVRFVNCTFGFSTDERGARLADAISLGQRSFAME